MTNLENIAEEIPSLVDSLKLTMGDANHLRQEIIRISNLQEQLSSLKKDLEGKLGFEKMKNMAMGALPFLGTVVANFFIPGGFLIDAAIAGGAGFIAEKFGNLETESSLNDLMQMIEEWSDWSHWLEQIAEEIIAHSHVLKQLELNSNNLSLIAEIKEVDRNLRVNLTFDNPQLLQKQIQKITVVQNELLFIQNRINAVIQNIGDCQDVLKILVGLSIFFGKSGFALEWVSDEYGLIVSSDRQSHALSDILTDCESCIEKVGVLISQGNSLRGEAEQALRDLEVREQKIEFSENRVVVVQNVDRTSQKQISIRPPLLVTALSLVVVGFSVWLAKDKFSGTQQVNLSVDREGSAVVNFESAQKLAMEASLLVQNPPHSIQVWQQAQLKWERSLNLLQSIPESASVSDRAKKQLAIYRTNYEAINKRLVSEKQAEENFKSSQKLAMEAAVIVQNPPHSVEVWQRAQLKWQQAIDLLENIPDSTSVSKQAKDKLSSYKTNYAAISNRLKN